MFSVEEVSIALARQSHKVADSPATNGRAAVAIILAGAPGHLNICMIRRASFRNDVWSGHVALPGGGAKVGETVEEAVARESREEVGVRLKKENRLGALAAIDIRLAGRERRIALSSIVYYIGENLVSLRSGEEVEEAFWLPVDALWNVGNATALTLPDRESMLMYPAVQVGSHVIWGVTLRVLTLFSDVISHPLPHFEEIPGLRL